MKGGKETNEEIRSGNQDAGGSKREKSWWIKDIQEGIVYRHFKKVKSVTSKTGSWLSDWVTASGTIH